MLPSAVVRGRKNPAFLKLPARLKRARRAAGLDCQALSIKAGLSPNVAFYIERNGRVPRLDVVEQLAAALDVAPGWLAFGRAGETASHGKPDHIGVSVRLRAVRDERALSANALGQAAEVATGTILYIEKGRTVPSVETVEKLAKALKISPAWLSFGS